MRACPIRRRATSLLIVFAASSCNGHSARPEDARGDTPVRFVNCDAAGSDCFVTARFADLDGCERYKTFSDAYCDSMSTPGRILCDNTRSHLSTAKAYCLP
jgi:hypothetical protein